MVKPHDISQDAWDEAKAMLAEEYDAAYYPTYAAWARQGHGAFTLCAITVIARAILAAEQREREACKAIADNYAVEPDPDETDPYDDYEMGGRSTARQVSRLIANRGEHHD